MWIVLIRDQSARSVQSDLDLHCPQKLLVSSSVRKELIGKKKPNNINVNRQLRNSLYPVKHFCAVSDNTYFYGHYKSIAN